MTIMNKLTFVKCIEYLNAYYVNLKLDIDNKLVQQVWFETLKEIDDASFELLVRDYSKNNIFPPQSPTHLLEHFKKMTDAYVIKIGNELRIFESNYRVHSKDNMSFHIDYEKAIKEAPSPDIRDLLLGFKSGKIKNYKPETIREYLSTKNGSLLIGEGNHD